VNTASEDRAPAGPILLQDLTSEDTAAIARSGELVILPVGAHEQHGAALPVSTDTISAQVLAGLIGTLLRPRVVVAPAIPWGVSPAHMNRSGTISLRHETLIAIVEDVVGSLAHHGFSRFVLLNGHGGNNAALRIAAERCAHLPDRPLVVPIYSYSLIGAAGREFLGPDAPGHGGGDEASVILSTRPDLVKRDRLVDPERQPDVSLLASVLDAVQGSLPVMQTAYSAEGTTGNATKATPEAGQQILGQATNQLRAVIEQLLDTPRSLLPDLTETLSRKDA
jgi:creatinine amidohydrolase